MFTEQCGFKEIKTRIRSMIPQPLLIAIYNAGMYCSNLEGDFMELGCHNGGVSFMLSSLLRDNHKLHAFDSFVGFHNIAEQDGGFPYREDYKSDYNNVCSYLDNTKCIIYKGWVEDTLTNVSDKQFSLIHFDMDTYSSTKFALNFLWDKVVSGGVVVFDNYLHWMGEKRAVDEFFGDLFKYNHWLLSPQLGVVKP